MVVCRLHEYRPGGTIWGAWLGLIAGVCGVQEGTLSDDRTLLQLSEMRASTEVPLMIMV
jgi:hypothetical protein